MKQLSDLIYKGLLHLQRKEYLLENIPNCPNCLNGHGPVNQIQLIDYVNVIPAKWKCRQCKFEFEYEPKEEPKDEEQE